MTDDLDERLADLVERLATGQDRLGFGTRELWMRTTIHGWDVRVTSGSGDVHISARSDDGPLMSATLAPDGVWRPGTRTDPRPHLAEWIDDLETAPWTCAWFETLETTP